MPDAGWFQTRTDALAVACPYCPADPGEPCVVPDGRGGWAPLERFPAHTARINTARKVDQS